MNNFLDDEHTKKPPAETQTLAHDRERWQKAQHIGAPTTPSEVKGERMANKKLILKGYKF